MISFFKFMNDWGIWDIVSLVICLLPSIAIIWYIWPRKKMKDVYINAIADDGPNDFYSRVITIKIRNHSNSAIYIESQGFKFDKTISPHPEAEKDHNTNVYEVKFEGRNSGTLSDIDTLVRAKQEIKTWIPINNEVTKERLAQAINSKEVGKLKLRCMLISQKPSKLFPFEVKI